ncbi:hypothetical protein Sru01_25010 [Sphaerisporangium rufum]|uniref:DUF4232 domain-containing protein n=1 Tax=Sphaerisporangium rufum TaxID=1381558 RepID=A0A919UZ89_9ACTN|nr:hypothetical protein [Sphaerisporangium rufum]GII77519.1 hypothetical protein Sru01_25010 [Sphaerisporangium rufum]
MDPDTFRGDVGVEGPDVYWRRRVSVLTGALVVVAVVAWACTSASGSRDRPRPETSRSPHASPSAGPARPPAPSGRPPVPGAAAPGVPPSGACADADLVLSLHRDAKIHPARAGSGFLLTVVNVGRAECAVDVGPRAVEVRITSGDDRVWSTADCLSGDGTRVRRLRRGVPYVQQIDWDRRRSAPDCRAARPRARAGTYVARARLGGLASPEVVFHLR